MNGDGTGRILGINDPALFWVLAGERSEQCGAEGALGGGRGGHYEE